MPDISAFSPITTFPSFTIASGTDSDAIDLGGTVLCGLFSPASISSTTVSFEVSANGTDFFAAYDNAGVAISYTIAASTYTQIDPAVFAGVRFIKLIFGSSETSKTFTLSTRSIG